MYEAWTQIQIYLTETHNFHFEVILLLHATFSFFIYVHLMLIISTSFLLGHFFWNKAHRMQIRNLLSLLTHTPVPYMWWPLSSISWSCLIGQLNTSGHSVTCRWVTNSFSSPSRYFFLFKVDRLTNIKENRRPYQHGWRFAISNLKKNLRRKKHSA